MALTKEVVNDRIEVIGDEKHLQIRQATVIKEDGKELSRSFKRRQLYCGDWSTDDKWTDTDISSESADIKGIANSVWDQAAKDAQKANDIARRPTQT